MPDSDHEKEGSHAVADCDDDTVQETPLRVVDRAENPKSAPHSQVLDKIMSNQNNKITRLQLRNRRPTVVKIVNEVQIF